MLAVLLVGARAALLVANSASYSAGAKVEATLELDGLSNRNL